ncbi:MAG: LytR C-terminal domain-containing protein [Candidatus Shapirobacteria bacterium]|nr:LytR C-terminal domain-containing protein [Candidatus Shapirobacteria bacterium]
MSLFSKPKIIIWPKTKTVELYIDRKENNTLSFDLDLWQKCNDKDLESLSLYFRQNKFSSISVLVPDDVVFTKSFTYDSKIESIDKKEVIGLAANLVNFPIDPDAIEYKLTQSTDKTIIQAFIYDKPKLDQLKSNLNIIGIGVNKFISVSTAISNTISSIYKQEFFLIYPLNDQEYTLLLSKDNSVYLTVNLKGPSLDIQKIINYSNFYFSNITQKIYVPEGRDLEIITTTQMDKTLYSESQIAQSLSKASNLPLPVLGEITNSASVNTDIISTPNNISSQTKMENKKRNILPIIAIFIFTAALGSVGAWFIFNKNSSEVASPASTSETSEPTIAPTATATPKPTVAEIEKDIKIQILNATEINGQAATLKAKLVALGFKNINVGNAKETATENSVQVKSASTSAYFESKLSSDFPATYTEDLKSSSTYDAVFVIGTDLSSMSSSTSSTDENEEETTPTVTKTTTKSATPTVTKAATKSATPTAEEE